MKYSFMSFSAPEAELSDLLNLAVKHGYDGLEPRIDAEHAHRIETSMPAGERDRAKKLAADSGIEIGCLGTSLQFAIEAQADATVAHAREAIDLAADLDCPALRVFGGQFSEGVTREQAAAQCAVGLSAVADYARGRGVVLAFETHDAWTDPTEVISVLQRVDHPSVRVNWDVMHPLRQSGLPVAEAFEMLKDWIVHVHVHDGSLDPENVCILPMGTGEIDHQAAIGLLKQAGYSGFISGEWILSVMPEDFQTIAHLGTEIAKLKEYEAQQR